MLGRCGRRVHLVSPWVESQATLGHATFWPLARAGLRGFPKIFFGCSQDYEWKPLALSLSLALCLQCLLLPLILQSTFIQCILILKSEIKNSIFQNWGICPNINHIAKLELAGSIIYSYIHDRAAFSRPVVWMIINHMSFSTQRTKVNYRPAQWSMRYTQHLRYTGANFRVS